MVRSLIGSGKSKARKNLPKVWKPEGSVMERTI